MRPLLLLVLVTAWPASAEIFRCTTPEGKTLYSDAPCPRGSKVVEISNEVGACTDAQCQAERDRVAAAARDRLKEDQANLAAMTESRHKAEAAALAERVKLEELRRLSAIDEQLSAELEASAYPAYPGLAYPWYPALPCTPPCGGRHHARPHPRPGQGAAHRREPAVSLRDFEKTPR